MSFPPLTEHDKGERGGDTSKPLRSYDGDKGERKEEKQSKPLIPLE